MNNTNYQERFNNGMKRGANNYAQQNNQQPVEQKEPLRIKVKPEEFESVSRGKLITVTKLAGKINQIFKPVLEGYEGCTVMPNQFGQQIEVCLYFKDVPAHNTGKKLVCLESVLNTGRNLTAAQRIMNMNTAIRNKKYQLTEQAKEVLTPFIKGTGKNGAIKWNEIVQEETSQDYSSYGRYSIYVKVPVDITKILRTIWGKRKGDSTYEYMVNIVKPLSTSIDGMATDWLLSIQQLDVKEIEKVANEVGLVPTAERIPIIR